MNLQQRLGEIFVKYQDMSWQWGVHDCCMFTANVLSDLFDKDYAASFRGEYNTEKGAYKILKAKGGLRTLANTMFLTDELIPFQCKPGYPMLAKFDDRETLGICIGAKVIFIHENGSYIDIFLHECICGWKVEEKVE